MYTFSSEVRCQCQLFSLFVSTVREIKYFQGAEEKLSDQWSLEVPFIRPFLARRITYGLAHPLVEAIHSCVWVRTPTLWETFKRVEKVLAWLLRGLISSASLRPRWSGACITELSTWQQPFCLKKCFFGLASVAGVLNWYEGSMCVSGGNSSSTSVPWRYKSCFWCFCWIHIFTNDLSRLPRSPLLGLCA